MAEDLAVVVVYCDGATSAQHDATPIAVYRRIDGWLPIHSGMFRGEPFVVGPTGIDHLIEDKQISDADALRRLGEPGRSQYRWRCPQPGCFDLMANDIEAVHRMFDVAAPVGELSLSLIDYLQKANAKRRRARRGGR